MNKDTQPKSLEFYFRKQAVRWAVIAFFLILIFVFPCFLYSIKLSAERQVFYLARAATRAFRPMLLDGKIRDAEIQMRKALELKPNESAVVFTPELRAIYPLYEHDEKPRCKTPSKACWSKSLKKVSILYPIHFDDQSRTGELYGYLGLTLQPELDGYLTAVFATLLLVIFVLQAYGLTSALTQFSSKLIQHLNRWADHLINKPDQKWQPRPIPYTELKPMQAAVDGLYDEIAQLKAEVAKEAKTKAHISLLKEISHDLRTPHSQLAKFFAIVEDTVRTTGKFDESEVKSVKIILSRMGELLKQARTLSFDSEKAGFGKTDECQIDLETENVCHILLKDPQLVEKKIGLEVQIQVQGAKIAVSSIHYYRLLENLIRNAIEAVPEAGKIQVFLSQEQEKIQLQVRDNGPGIPEEIQPQIFDFEFTTKSWRGTGLGLGIVQQVCKSAGAQLSLQSSPDSGTVFTVRIPILSNHSLKKEKIHEPTHHFGRG